MPSNDDLIQMVLGAQVQTPITSLSNASAVSSGTALDNVVITRMVAVQVTASATLTAGALQVQSSLDGTNWSNVGSPIALATDFTAAGTKIYTFTDANNGAAEFWRASITTAVTGGTITVKIKAL